MAPGASLDFFHHNHYIVTASFTNDQHAIVSQFIKRMDVEWWSKTSASPRCLEVPVSAAVVFRTGALGGFKWDFWSRRDFLWLLGG